MDEAGNDTVSFCLKRGKWADTVVAISTCSPVLYFVYIGVQKHTNETLQGSTCIMTDCILGCQFYFIFITSSKMISIKEQWTSISYLFSKMPSYLGRSRIVYVSDSDATVRYTMVLYLKKSTFFCNVLDRYNKNYCWW